MLCTVAPTGAVPKSRLQNPPLGPAGVLRRLLNFPRLHGDPCPETPGDRYSCSCSSFTWSSLDTNSGRFSGAPLLPPQLSLYMVIPTVSDCQLRKGLGVPDITPGWIRPCRVLEDQKRRRASLIPSCSPASWWGGPPGLVMPQGTCLLP